VAASDHHLLTLMAAFASTSLTVEMAALRTRHARFSLRS